MQHIIHVNYVLNLAKSTRSGDAQYHIYNYRMRIICGDTYCAYNSVSIQNR